MTANNLVEIPGTRRQIKNVVSSFLAIKLMVNRQKDAVLDADIRQGT